MASSLSSFTKTGKKPEFSIPSDRPPHPANKSIIVESVLFFINAKESIEWVVSTPFLRFYGDKVQAKYKRFESRPHYLVLDNRRCLQLADILDRDPDIVKKYCSAEVGRAL